MTRKASFIRLAILTVALMVSLASMAESPVSIVTHITAGMRHTVNMPDSLEHLLQPSTTPPAETDSDSEEDASKRTVTAGRGIGYRIQVFSDNNPRTAKNEARSKQRSISSRFPQYRSYVTFNSPYWRLKVGDFRTQQEANQAAAELKRVFPAYSKEIRVVRDRINLSN